MNKKRILCYGDSNTWGYIPSSDMERYDSSIRYPKVLQALLGEEYEVIEEGLPGRTLDVDTFKEFIGNRNGALTFPQTVYSHLPLDYILIMLGTNDMKEDYDRSVKEDCVNALKEFYLKPIRTKLNGKIKNDPKIIVVAPAIIKGGINEFTGAESRSAPFNEEYARFAKENNCLFVSNDGLENGSDHIHLTIDSHLLLAKRIYQLIKESDKKDNL